jgi:hypothetical protein
VLLETSNHSVVCDGIAVISYLCKDSPTNQALFVSKGGLQLLLPHLKEYIASHDKNKITEQTVIAVMECIWSATTATHVQYFLQLDGVDTLLDLLEVCPVPLIQRQIIGCLCDLCSTAEVKWVMMCTNH